MWWIWIHHIICALDAAVTGNGQFWAAGGKMTSEKRTFPRHFTTKPKLPKIQAPASQNIATTRDKVSWEVGQFFSISLYIKYYLYQSILKIFFDVEEKTNYPTAQMGLLIMVAGFQLGSCWVIG